MHECCFHLISFVNFQLTLSLILICIFAYSDLRLHECGSFSSSQYVYLNVEYTPNTNFRYNSTWIYFINAYSRASASRTVNRSYSSSFPLIRIGNDTLHMLSIILTMSYKPNRFHIRYSCMIFVFAEVQVERRFSSLVLDF